MESFFSDRDTRWCGERKSPASREEQGALTTDLQAKEMRTAKLRQKYEQALQEETVCRSVYYDALDVAARTECLELTGKMYTKLPTELRETIYQYLCTEDQTIYVAPHFHFRLYGHNHSTESSTALVNALSNGRTKVDHTESPDPDILQPWSHIFHPAYVGNSVASETQKTYFTNNTFSVCNVDDGIRSFLLDGNYRRPYHHRDASEADAAPDANVATPLDLVRNLQIRIKCEHIETAINQGLLKEDESVYRESFANECNFLRQTRNSLRPLLKLACHEQEQPLDLDFIIMTKFLGPDLPSPRVTEQDDHSRLFINILQAIRNTVYALMYDCGHTNIKIKITHHDELVSPFPRNLTALWSLTKEQWEHEKLANVGKVAWDADFYLMHPLMAGDEVHGRFLAFDEHHLLRERWGISDAFRDRRPQWPIVEGRYWPVGNDLRGCWN